MNKQKKETAIACIAIVILCIMIFLITDAGNDLLKQRDYFEKESKQLKQQIETEEKQHDRDIARLQIYIDTLKHGEWLYMGKFTTTGYCKCKKCCGKWSNSPTFTGTTPEQGRTVAVDPSVIPLGSTILINGIEYIAEDTGSAIKGNKIDIYFSNHDQAVKHGKRYNKDVFVKIQ